MEIAQVIMKTTKWMFCFVLSCLCRRYVTGEARWFDRENQEVGALRALLFRMNIGGSF